GGGATYRMIDAFSGADWKFKATVLGGFKIRDQANGLDVFQIEQLSLANAFYIKAGGNIGLGLTTPNENLHLTGALVLGGATAAATATGTIDWSGTNFRGFDGTNWLDLGIQNDGDWLIQPGVPGNLELVPAIPPASVSLGPPGAPNMNAYLWVTDLAALPPLFPHFLMLESSANGGFDVSQLYRISNQLNPPFLSEYSVGIFAPDLAYKVTNGPVLAATSQSDGMTMIRANQSGIIDHPNQSRVRAYQNINDPKQQIPNAIWEPINFTRDAPLNQGWDEHNEFTVAPSSQAGIPPTNAYFTATEEGYYQVNSRTHFEVYEVMDPQWGGYVSIAIYIDNGSGFQPHAIGNNLQVIYAGPAGSPELLENNNAPNVADVVYLNVGDRVAIYVWQSTGVQIPIKPGNAITYVSIHKDS
ncbi:MAG: hypothetical protein K8R46_04205, partial [Pirellulales bacterium]|nr:hypothetical protein [Pirellulales bacterium]